MTKKEARIWAQYGLGYCFVDNWFMDIGNDPASAFEVNQLAREIAQRYGRDRAPEAHFISTHGFPTL